MQEQGIDAGTSLARVLAMHQIDPRTIFLGSGFHYQPKVSLGSVALRRARIGTEPSEWAKEHLKAVGMSPEEIETVAARFSYSDWPEAASE